MIVMNLPWKGKGFIVFWFLLFSIVCFNGYADVVDETGLPENLDAVRSFIDISYSTLQRLYKDGIVVLGNDQYYSLSDPNPLETGGLCPDWNKTRKQGYAPFAIESNFLGSGLWEYITRPLMKDVSVVVTADACLWFFHLVFDDMLKMTEKLYLDADLKTLVAGIREKAIYQWGGCTQDTHPDVKEAYKQLVIFVLVADSLLNPDTYIPSEFDTDVGKIVNIIMSEPTDFHCYPEEYDWSQFKPRGHYAGDEQLERYFRAMKWISKRIWQVVPLENVLPFGVDPPEEYKRHNVELIAAASLAKLLHENSDLYYRWSRIYDLTSLLAGMADSITPAEAYRAFANVLGGNYDPAELVDEDKRTAAIAEFQRSVYPASRIGLPCCLNLDGHICGFPSKYFQLMGERYLVDSELFQRISDDYPLEPKQNVIHPLDVAAGVLGSTNARDILRGMNALELESHDLPYLEELNETWDEEDWTSSSVYNGWLHALRGLVEDVPSTAPAPQFAKTRAYGDKQVMTALASWTHLRRDFILYGKQSFGGTVCLGGYGIVEPCPELYHRLADLCGFVHRTFRSFNINLDDIETPEDEDNPYMVPIRKSQTRMNLDTALVDLQGRLYEFEAYARKEMRGEPLTCNEQDAIHLFGSWIFNQYFFNIVEKSPAQIADVHTDNWAGVLETATGWFNPALYLYKEPEGKSLVGLGFVMSHYEFWTGYHNLTRLTDAEWEEKLAPVEESTYPRKQWQNTFLHFPSTEDQPSENDPCGKAIKIETLPFLDRSVNLYWNAPTTAIDPEAPDAWWLLAGPGEGRVLDVIAQGGAGPVDISMWTGSCSSLDLVASSTSFEGINQARLNFITNDAPEYYIRISSKKFQGSYQTRQIELIVDFAEASDNNTCASARLIDRFPKIDVSGTLATNSVDRPPIKEDPHPGWPDAFWLLPRLRGSDRVEITTRRSQVPTAIFVFEGGCDNLALVDHDDSTCVPGNGFARVVLSGKAATSASHLIAVSGQEGPVALNVFPIPTLSAQANGLLSREDPPDGADVNIDGRIDAADLVTIINAIGVNHSDMM